MTLYDWAVIIWAILLVGSFATMKYLEQFISLKYYDQTVVDVSLGSETRHDAKKEKGGNRVQKMPGLRSVS